MKKIVREDLFKILDKMKYAVEKTDALPILQTICFRNDHLVAYNKELGMRAEFNSGLGFAVPFVQFYNLIKSLKTESVEFDLRESNLVIKSGNVESEIAVRKETEFPNFDETYSLIENSLDLPLNFCEQLKTCVIFASRNKVRPSLRGILLDNDKMVATDGRQLCQISFDSPFLDGRVFFPLDFVRVLLSLGSAEFFYCSNDKLIVQSGEFLLFGATFFDNYPSVESYFKIDGEFFSLPVKELSEALQRVGDFSGESQEIAICTVEISDIIRVFYEGSSSKIVEYFKFGESFKYIFSINPYNFKSMLDNCEKFFIGDASIHGQSEDGKFKSVCVIKPVADKDLPF